MSDFYKDNMNLYQINGFDIQEVAKDVYAIDEFGIDIMYLVIGTKKALLIDTGIGLGDIRAVVETMTDLPYVVVNTHHHYDHAGGNGHFDCVYAPENAISVIKSQNNVKQRQEFFEEQKARMEYNHMASLTYDAKFVKQYNLKGIREGDRFLLGNRELEVIETPGHTKDSICLLDSENRILFSADTIVSTPTLIFDSYSDTMENYLLSLKKLRDRRDEYELIFPGHYLRPIGELYIDHMIKCVEEVLNGHLLDHIHENKSVEKTEYIHRYGLASVLYNKGRI